MTRLGLLLLVALCCLAPKPARAQSVFSAVGRVNTATVYHGQGAWVIVTVVGMTDKASCDSDHVRRERQ